MLEIIFVGTGGCIGAVLRYIITKQSSNLINSNFPLGTLLVNVIGGFLIGLIMELSNSTELISPNLRLFLTTGIMGGLTTFSTFSYETITLMSNGSFVLGTVNVLLNVTLSLGGVLFAKLLCKVIV
ncbi:fluoride efflux transporter CrcB [Clostridium sp. SHJSY1]|uniref:fluoride efflux transporter CrcB n=1 Tax=Clostridium sp. SHJSY1 TaxID=2942483 RepID=UPI0028753514|nr:fluoride efflux transporter CrcB [Clostridium sp. SHJSY1]MDS0527552.1 fluoride efflux transporter CrcB [Clostridium sp. SHJSY1]